MITPRYRSSRGIESATASYCLSALQALAEGQQPEGGETAAEYARRHLTNLQEHHYVVDTKAVKAAPVVAVLDMQAACTERLRQLEPNGYPMKEARA